VSLDQDGPSPSPRRRRTIAVVALAAAVASARRSPPIRLRPVELAFPTAPADVVARFERKLLDSGKVERSLPGEYIGRFSGQAGPFSYDTRELVRVEGTTITFDHLEGPFRTCVERFGVRPDHGASKRSVVTHEGTFTMRGGLAGWLLGISVVRGLFERLVEREMHAMAADALRASAGAA
jgi:hypothetical protein